jgi:hypothetical protein
LRKLKRSSSCAITKDFWERVPDFGEEEVKTLNH